MTELTLPDEPTALAALVEYSRRLGSDESLVLGGGGNTSVKATGTDVTGRSINVLYIKGSGSELKSSTPRDYPGLRLADLLLLQTRAELSDEDMVAYLEKCKLEPTAPRPSIETLLHAFIPAVSVFHSHADAILTLVNTKRSQTVVDVFGDDVVGVPYQRPGFALSVAVANAVAGAPNAQAVILLNHGLVTWGDSPAAAYERHLEIVARAASYIESHTKPQIFVTDAPLAAEQSRRRLAAQIAPVVRGALSRAKHIVLAFDDAPETLAFVSSSRARHAAMQGALTPDHILTTKNLPLFLDLPREIEPASLGASVDSAFEQYQRSYADYVARWRTNEPELDAQPRVIAVPGVGLFTAGRDHTRAQLARDIYRHTMRVMAAAESLGGYRSLSEGEAFRAEYWPLELYKLSRAAPERELAGRIAFVTGAGSGLGRASALALAEAGAHVFVTDLDGAAAAATAAGIKKNVVAAELDVTSEAAVENSFEQVCREFGGVDIVVSNAGFAHSAAIEQLDVADWERSLAVNATGHFLVTRAALRRYRAQRIGGSIVFIASKNVTAPGAEFAAYSAAKAAQAQLARVAAIEAGPLGVRVNMVNPDAIFAGTHLWDEIAEQRAAAHGVTVEQLREFYRKRSLLGLEVRAEDVAAAVVFLASDRSSRTTGCMIPVDAGVREAFPR